MKYEDYDLIITTNNVKKEILKYFSNKIVKTKIMTKTEINNMILGKIKNEGKIELIKEFNISYNLAKVYLNNIIYKPIKLNKYYEFLFNNSLIEFNNNKNNYKNILVINVNVDKYIIKYFNNSTINYLESTNNFVHDVYEFDMLDKEVSFVCFKILDLLEKVDINNIKLVNVGDEYITSINKIFSMCNLPVNINNTITIIKTNTFEKFINLLKNNYDLEKSLSDIPKDEVYELLIDYFNKNNYDKITDLIILIILDDFKNVSIKKENLKNAIEIINLDDIMYDDKYYFVFGLNEGSLPKTKKNEDFLTDDEKLSLNITTSYEYNKFNEELFINIYKNCKNLFLSYKLSSSFNSYSPSYLIEDLNMNIIKNSDTEYKYSNVFNELEYAKSLDDLYKYNVINNNLSILSSNYNIKYREYNNVFKGLIDYKKDNLRLSYSSLITYNNCAFRYYVDKVLKLNSFEETLSTLIGSTFHYVLSKIYENDFNINNVYSEYLKDKVLDNKTKYYLDVLKDELILIIDYIRKFDKDSKLNNVLNEKEVTINDIIPGKVSLYGIVDKIKYNSDKTLAIIIDYKTGSITSSLNNINVGLNLQLPIYVLLTKELMPDIQIGGFYLQKILNNPKMDEDQTLKESRLKLEGYTLLDEKLISEIDCTYENSDYIKSMKTTKTGFGAHAKLLSYKQIEKLQEVVLEQVKSSANKILDGDFSINPKKINDDNVGCMYCNYKDLCYLKEEDVVEINNTKIEDILGGEDNA